MRFMIRCDVEGVTGVTHSSQVSPDSPTCAYGLDMLRHDLNAVVDGLLTAGDHEIWVYDMHYYGRNLDMRRLNQRLRVICGKPPYLPGNVGGLTAEFDGQILLGLHSKAGSGELLCHSYEHQIRNILLNGTSVGEIGLEAALAGELGVPTIMVTGDSAGCAEARSLLGEVVTVTVKDSLGLNAAVCYPTTRTGELLQAGASAAAEKTTSMKPFRITPPVTLGIVLENGSFADHVRAKLAPHTQQDGSVNIPADSVAAAWLQYLLARPPMA